MRIPGTTRTSRARAAIPGIVVPPRLGTRRVAAFTMVEIAISIAVVAFAMVAIIGVLPTGFQVQRQNSEDTIVNQDGMLWIEAIRGGAQGMDYLTNYVEQGVIQVLSQRGASTRVWTNRPFELTGRDIVGLLTYPRYTQDRRDQWWTNTVVAYVQSVSGSAINKTPQNDFDLKYRLTATTTPVNPTLGFQTNLQEFNLSPAEFATRSNLVARTVNRGRNLHDLSLALEWPVYTASVNGRPQRRVGNNRKVFRTLVSGNLLTTNVAYLSRELYFVQPSEFLQVPAQ